ncbi:hypothetical protein GCM10009737_20050 [Nocardioides lentus]|uniref:PepSY domain-containing protein n=1 Tax=Nocardioides lentus TaxID=338077 RepID=A0ABP5ANE7_9ACTN
MSTRPFRHRLAALAVAPLAVVLVACGSDDDGDTDAGTPSATVTVTESPEGDASSTPDDTGSQDDGAASGQGGQGGGGDLRTAAETALGELSGATLITVDRDDNGDWDVTLLTQDGVENDVDVSADGSTVTRGPVADDNDDDGDDRAERQRLLDASVDYAAAIETAAGEVTDLDVTGVDLDEDNGTLRWDVDFGDDTDDDQRTVLVDAASGQVIGTEQDDDGDDD